MKKIIIALLFTISLASCKKNEMEENPVFSNYVAIYIPNGIEGFYIFYPNALFEKFLFYYSIENKNYINIPALEGLPTFNNNASFPFVKIFLVDQKLYCLSHNRSFWIFDLKTLAWQVKDASTNYNNRESYFYRWSGSQTNDLTYYLSKDKSKVYYYPNFFYNDFEINTINISNGEEENSEFVSNPETYGSQIDEIRENDQSVQYIFTQKTALFDDYGYDSLKYIPLVFEMNKTSKVISRIEATQLDSAIYNYTQSNENHDNISRHFFHFNDTCYLKLQKDDYYSDLSIFYLNPAKEPCTWQMNYSFENQSEFIYTQIDTINSLLYLINDDRKLLRFNLIDKKLDTLSNLSSIYFDENRIRK